MSDQSATEGTAPEAAETTTPEGPPEWLSPITERMEEISEQQRQMQDAMAGFAYEPEEEEFTEAEEYADDEDLSPEAARRIIGSEVDSRVEERFAKRDAERALNERNDSFEALQDELPALQDDKYARQLVQEAAQELRDHNAEHLIGTPYIVTVIERLHNERRYAERDAAEKPEKDVVLESGSGAAPQQQDEEDWGDRIVAAASNLRPTI